MPIGVGHLAAHTSSVATCAASTMSNQRTVVMGERPGGSLEPHVCEPAVGAGGDGAAGAFRSTTLTSHVA
jgi:hypothetical protein